MFDQADQQKGQTLQGLPATAAQGACLHCCCLAPQQPLAHNMDPITSKHVRVRANCKACTESQALNPTNQN